MLLMAASSLEAIASPLLMRCRSSGSSPSDGLAGAFTARAAGLQRARSGQPDPSEDSAPARLAGGDTGIPRLVATRRARGPAPEQDTGASQGQASDARRQDTLRFPCPAG